MRILFFANEDDGLYRFRKELISSLREDNEVVISVPNGEYRDYFEKLDCKYIDTPVDRRGMNPLKDLKLLSEYKKIIKSEKPDLVITYTIKCNIYGGMAAKKYKVPYVANITGLGSAFEGNGIVRKLVTILYKNALKKVKTVFFENENNKDLFVNDKIVDVNKCHVLHGAGVNLGDFSVLPMNYEGVTRLLFIGRVMKEKGVDELFAVARRCKSENMKVVFDLIGDFEDNYKETVDKLVNEGIINFHGFQSNIKPFVENSHAIILPSYHEGMSNALLEGASSGRPLLTTDIPGCREAVIDGETGYLFKKADADDLYEKIKQFASLSREQQRNMGIAGRKHMEDAFDKNKVVAETIKVIGL